VGWLDKPLHKKLENLRYHAVKARKDRETDQILVSVKSVQSNARCLWRAGFEKKISFEVVKEE